jgi:hypothetical protein
MALGAYVDPTNTRDRLTRLNQLKLAMWRERSTFDAHYRELQDFLMPRRTRWYVGDRNKGDRRSQKIIDSTGRFAVRTLQSGLHAGLTSPARPWFKLTTPDPDLAKSPPVSEWLYQVTKRMLAVFIQTNLYNSLPIIYGDMGVFAVGAMSMIEDRRDLFRCYPYPIGSYAIGLDDRCVATSFGRDYQLSVRQVVQQFGLQPDGRTVDWSVMSKVVKNQWDEGNYEAPVDVVWMVTPNLLANPKRLEARYKPWASCYYEKGGEGDTFLRESGFDTFPILAPRWDITGEDTYGTDSPGMIALGDIKSLQLQQRKKAQAINKQIDPPLVGPSSLRTQKTSLISGDITYVDTPSGHEGLRSIHEVNLNLRDLNQSVSDTQFLIERAFYVDLFMMIAQSDQRRGAQPVTAREIEERHEEKLLALGPVLERLNDELLEPLIDRAYAMMDAAGLIPPPPEALHGVKLKAEYTSIMAQAQKIVGVVMLDRFVQSVFPLVQADPSLAAKVDGKEIINEYAEMLGTPPKVLRSNEDADAMNAAAAAKQQAVMDAEVAQKNAAAMKDASQASMQGDTALTRIVGGAAGSTPGVPTPPISATVQ